MEWISVEEGLPDKEVDVLAMLIRLGSSNVICNNLMRVFRHTEINGEEGWYEQGEFDDVFTTEECVTHWMPLPSPPQCS